MSIGSRILDARKRLKMTQAELASRCGVKKTAISNYENGVSTPDTARLTLIMQALEVDPNYIYQDYFDVSDVVSLDSKEPINLTKEEVAIVLNYRSADDHTRKLVRLALGIE